jgi:hypothetical protein
MPLRRAGLAVVATILSVAAIFLLAPLATEGLMRLLDLALTGCIWLATSLGSDADFWAVVTAVGWGIARSLATTRALGVVAILVLLSALALYGLHYLLGNEGESSS